MPRPSINETPMTGTERQARYRTSRAAGVPVLRLRRPADRRSRIRRWHDAVEALADLQAEYAGWLDALPENQHGSALAEALQAIVEFDLSELQAIEPPRGFSAGHEERNGPNGMGQPNARDGRSALADRRPNRA
jgi:hypothetical protein